MPTDRAGGAGERGAVLVTMTVGLVTLLVVAALVLDLAAVRVNRAHSLVITDAAAAAGSLELAARDGQAGCEAAIDYLELNLDTSLPFSGINCNPFPSKCDDMTPEHTTSGTADEWTVTIVYPVLDSNPMLDPAAIGAGPQAIHTGDGHPCDRIGVQLDSEHDTFFARIMGTSSQTTEVHTVALAATPVDGEIPLNLLILERYDCRTLSAGGGGGGSGGIIVDAVVNPTTGEVEPGFIALDSDGSGAGCSGNGTIDVDGSGSEIRSDGPEGCAGQIGSHTKPGGYKIGHGCGEIRTFALGTPGCNWPACTSGGTVAPDPTPLLDRKTRAEVDYRFNCKASYPFPVGWEIDGCPFTPAPYIDNLVAAYGAAGTTPPGFVTWSSLGHSCNAPSVTVTGNIRVDCANFRVSGTTIFEGGNVIFDNNVTVNSSGILAINSDGTKPFPYQKKTDEATAYFRGGTISKAGQGSLVMHRTLGYFAPGVRLKMTGGSGALVWTAPTTGNFDDLALWSESDIEHELSGQATLGLEGVFFVPNATVSYQGSGTQKSVEAQFIVRKLTVGGNGKLVVGPSYDRAVLFPVIVAQLIR
jgi:hypothetical protein